MSKKLVSKLSPTVIKKLEEMNLDAEAVVRKALNIKFEGFDAGYDVHLPEGTRFMVWHKGSPYGGKVVAGELVMNGKTYKSLRAAAEAITGRETTNAWGFWTVALPNSEGFFPIADLRKDK